MASIGDVTRRLNHAVDRARQRYPVVDVVVGTLRRFSEDDGGVLAAALTYYTFFSIFPLLLFAASAIGYLTFLSEGFRDALLRSSLDAFPLLDSIVGDPGILDQIKEQRGTLALIALVLALYAGSGGVSALGHALNRVYRVEEERAFFPKRLNSIKWLTLLGVTVVVSVGLGTASNYAGDLLGTRSNVAEAVLFTVGHLGGVLVGLLIFLTAFKLLPNTDLTWRNVLPGALLASVVFEVLKIVGTFYIQQGTEGRQETFGAFAAAATLLVASYLLAQVTLLSAELNAVLAERRAAATSSDVPDDKEAPWKSPLPRSTTPETDEVRRSPPVSS